MPEPSVKLKVMEALQEEAYKGVVRIDTQTMRIINVRPGDIVEIEGGRKTVALVDRAYPTDLGEGVIRMDGIMRRNAKTGIGETVIVRKAEVKEAKSITIAPAQEGVYIQADPGLFRRGLLGRALVKGDIVSLGGAQRRRKTMAGSPFEDIFEFYNQGFMGSFAFGGLKFVVVDTNPKQPVIVSELTEININPKAVEVTEEKVPEVTYEDIGGLTDEVKKVREMVELPLKHPQLFERLGIQPPKGVLLFGPPGTGKTLIAKAVANETDANFLLVNGPELTSRFYGDSEKKIRDLFEEAEKNAPSIIFIDEIDAIAPKREETYGEVEKRMVAQLLSVMDGLKSRGKIVVIGATNRPQSLDPALRRPGRFDREIQIGVPNKKARLNILKIHTRNMPLTKDVKLAQLAEITHGFVGADLAALCKEAAMSVIRKIIPKLNLEENQPIPNEVLENLIITQNDFKEALKVVRPSALREVLIEKPNIKWEQVGGMEGIKAELKEAIEWPLKNPKLFSKMGIRPTKGILLFGPPGTGKTLMVKAIATESEANFISVKGAEIMDKFVGEAEKAVKRIFQKARQAAPTIIFFDEIDAIAPRRGTDFGSKVTERVVNSLLTEMDGLEELSDVIVVASTNRPDLLDPALIRPGRFDKIIATKVPGKKARIEIFKVHTKTMPLSKEVNIETLVEKTDGYVGADIEAVCREAAMIALRENMDANEILMKHFEKALEKITPSLDEKDIKIFKELEETMKKAVPIEVPDYMR